MGVVRLPSLVTGFAAISINEEITFMPECQGSSNSSQWADAPGFAWRLILKMTVLELAICVLSKTLLARILPGLNPPEPNPPRTTRRDVACYVSRASRGSAGGTAAPT